MTWGVIGGAYIPKIFVVECKKCSRHIPANVEEFPKDNIRVDCPLCGEKRRYRPSEVYLGQQHYALGKQITSMSEHSAAASARRRRS